MVLETAVSVRTDMRQKATHRRHLLGICLLGVPFLVFGQEQPVAEDPKARALWELAIAAKGGRGRWPEAVADEVTSMDVDFCAEPRNLVASYIHAISYVHAKDPYFSHIGPG